MTPTIRKTERKNKQQNKIKTTNLNYVNFYLYIEKKINDKVKLASDKNKSEQMDFHFTNKHGECLYRE